MLTVGGAYLLMQSTYSYGHTTAWQGVSLAGIVLGSLVIWNFIGLQATEPLGKAGKYAAGATVAAAGVGAAGTATRSSKRPRPSAHSASRPSLVKPRI